ncbi:MAG TPA: type II toxin-antitoxin system CcdA family antitoxin [Steroidobacteraceae bacterium]|nr:type II toxin-antitoxin system CcdA family antitoxin [Steroidobacteraceae bacterium]
MPAGSQNVSRKRPVNLTLREDVVEEVKGVTDNLSGVVESLLVDFLAKERQRKEDVARQATATVALWNEFADRNGSFADDHSTL